VPADVERVFREEYGRAVAVLTRVFGDIDEPGRVDHHHRAQPGHRPAAPRGGP
jgi:hypothetical protein